MSNNDATGCYTVNTLTYVQRIASHLHSMTQVRFCLSENNRTVHINPSFPYKTNWNHEKKQYQVFTPHSLPQELFRSTCIETVTISTYIKVRCLHCFVKLLGTSLSIMPHGGEWPTSGYIGETLCHTSKTVFVIDGKLILHSLKLLFFFELIAIACRLSLSRRRG